MNDDDILSHENHPAVRQVSETSKADQRLVESQKEVDAMTRERERVQGELRRTLTVKDKLEELCRSLQQENKNVRGASRAF